MCIHHPTHQVTQNNKMALDLNLGYMILVLP